MKERIGNFAEGGKVMCNPAALRKVSTCTVVAFGVSGDISFESMLAARTPCKIHAHDPTVSNLSLSTWADLRRNGSRPMRGASHTPCGPAGGIVNFKRVGLGSNSSGTTLGGYPLHSLKSFLSRFPSIHVLKVDIEAAEWNVFDEIRPEQLRNVDQLLIELHFPQHTSNRNGPDLGVRQVFSLFRKCEAAGLFPFSWEVNHNPSVRGNKPWAIEYSFVRHDSIFTHTSLEFEAAASNLYLCPRPHLLTMEGVQYETPA